MKKAVKIVLFFIIAAFFCDAATAQVQLMSSAKLASVRGSLPQIENKDWHATIHSERNIVYTDKEMPRAYQHFGGFHSPSYNISADPTDMNLRHGEGGNVNVDFPWKHPGGTDYSLGHVTTYKQMLLPLREDGRQWPVVVWKENGKNPFGETEPLTKWIFPIGTTFSEILQTDINGQWLVFEIRTRTRSADYWDVEIFRPFPSCDNLASKLESIDPQGYSQTINYLRRRENLTEVDMTDRNNPKPGFSGKAGVAWMPRLDPATVESLLKTTSFSIATGGHWKKGENGVVCYSPTTDAMNQIVPVNYAGSIVGSDTVSCNKCHDSTLKHARHFNFSRGWYGFSRGNDKIFSFHPIEPRSISYSGAQYRPQLRKEFVAAGIVEMYDPTRHPKNIYSPLREGK